MSSHFSPKSLAFYGGTIVCVILLFSFVTAYGEANLKAPQPIGGFYQIDTQELPGCLASQPLDLLLQQSGVYLAGSLLPQDVAEQALKAAEKRPLLNGHWRNGQLTLQGRVDLSPDCQNTVTIEATAQPLQPTAQKSVTLNGRMQFGAGSQPTPFTASQQAPTDNSDTPNHKP